MINDCVLDGIGPEMLFYSLQVFVRYILLVPGVPSLCKCLGPAPALVELDHCVRVCDLTVVNF